MAANFGPYVLICMPNMANHIPLFFYWRCGMAAPVPKNIHPETPLNICFFS
jgi:hypothetical protein